MNFKYLLGVILSIPLLPIMYFQGKRIRREVPSLPEAKGNHGKVTLPTSKHLNILIIGESTMAGVGVATHEEGFSGALASELASHLNANITWKVYAKSGYTAKMVSQRLIPKIKEQHADVIIIGLGGNDAFTLNRPNKWKRHIQELIHILQTRYKDSIIVFTNMPPIKEFPAFTPAIKFTIGNLVEILGKELAVLVSEFDNVYYQERIVTIDSWKQKMNINEDAKDFFSDGVHPSKLTYQTWAKDFSNFIVSHEPIRARLDSLMQE